MSTCNGVDLQALAISTDYTQKSPQSLVGGAVPIQMKMWSSPGLACLSRSQALGGDSMNKWNYL